MDAIQCHRCVSQGVAESTTPLVDSIWDCRRHFVLVHCSEQQTMYQCFLFLEFIRTARGLKSHFHNLHERREHFFANPFQCPECIRTGYGGAPEIIGRKAWQDHNDQYHNGGAKEELLDIAVQLLKTYLHYPCLVCLKYYYSRETLAHHLEHNHGELFKKPFQCPECIRQGDRDAETFNNKHTWTLHVLQEHPAHRTNSVKCFCTDHLDASLTTELYRLLRRRYSRCSQNLAARICGFIRGCILYHP